LLKGAADFSACHVHVQDQLYILVPNMGIQKGDYELAEQKMAKLKQTKKYFQHFQKLIERRSTYKLRQKTAPYYVVYNSGSYTFAPYKVVWAELSTTFQAAVFTKADVPLLGSRPFVPDHKVYFADFQSEDIAHFVCGILNSTLIREYVESHTIQIQVSNIFKHLSIPKFNAGDKDHMTLVAKSKAAHSASSQIKRDKLLEEMNTISDRILIA